MDKETVSEERTRAVLEAEAAALARTKFELQRAKENAMQSWLDSRPLIDELEMQKSNLFKAETMGHEINHTLDQSRHELKRLDFSIKKGRHARANLRQNLQLRRQKLQTFQLTVQAILLESDARENSADESLHWIKQLEVHTAAVQLTHQEYSALTRAAEERFSQANQNVSVSMAKKFAAETRRDSALSRLNKLYSSRSSKMDRRNKTVQCETEMDAEKNDSSEKVVEVANKTGASPKALTKSEVTTATI